jgi:hypothetical protein
MKKAERAGQAATHDEMSYPDWQQRLERAERESRLGKGVMLDAYVKLREKIASGR